MVGESHLPPSKCQQAQVPFQETLGSFPSPLKGHTPLLERQRVCPFREKKKALKKNQRELPALFNERSKPQGRGLRGPGLLVTHCPVAAHANP